MKKIILFFTVISISTFALPLKNPKEILQIPIPGQYIIAHNDDYQINKSMFDKTQTILSNNGTTLSYIETNNSKSMIEKMLNQKSIKWIQPNYEYIGDVIEYEVNDEKFPLQQHHQIMQTPLAWDIHTGDSSIIVAVTDNGFALEHEDLKEQFWKNTKEIAGNGIDDDGNGYIDDYDGWNFADNNNNPRPDENSHGTHVAGIIAAQANNQLGVAGIAPNVKVMPIRFYSDSPWTSLVVANSYAYAVNNGAKIITTSYNIDGFVNDQVYLESLKMIKEKGALLFNSAGNNSRLNPPRSKFEDIILVCSTRSNPKKPNDIDKLSSFSNYGAAIDLCACGDPILSTVNGEYLGRSRYGELSGTSMASPAAAAVAALIWSKYPDFSPEQVLAKLLESADDISAQNPNRRGLFGAGRVNAFKALNE